MNFPNSRILIFAKAPEPGKVKTRLIPAIGSEQAASLYRKLLIETVERAESSRLAAIECWCAPDTRHPLFQQIGSDFGVSLQNQVEGDLGLRMFHAAARALESSDAALLVGGDCPVLTADYLRNALLALQKVDAVIGPAEDGGYVLLGLRRADPGLFRDIPWGGDTVLAMTRQRLTELNWSWHEMDTLWDLDRPEDLQRYRALFPGIKL